MPGALGLSIQAYVTLLSFPLALCFTVWTLLFESNEGKTVPSPGATEPVQRIDQAESGGPADQAGGEAQQHHHANHPGTTSSTATKAPAPAPQLLKRNVIMSLNL